MEGQGRVGHGGSLRFNTLAVRRGEGVKLGGWVNKTSFSYTFPSYYHQ